MKLATLGNLEAAASAVQAEPSTPDLSRFVESLGLARDERQQVEAALADLARRVSLPEGPVVQAPSIVKMGSWH